MLLDTSGLLCFFDNRDFRHRKASTFIKTAHTRLTTSYVLAEFVPLCQTRGLNRGKMLEFVIALVENPLVEIVWVDRILHEQGFALLQNRTDKSYSLCDAVSFVIMRERAITEALTTDKHFEQEGFIKFLES